VWKSRRRTWLDFWYHNGVSIGTVLFMSTNLRLSQEAAAALRDFSAKTGRSQQELIREAVDRFLGRNREPDGRQRAIEAGLVKAPTPFQDIEPSVRLGYGVTTAELLDRDGDR
jgi:hypothetical protein